MLGLHSLGKDQCDGSSCKLAQVISSALGRFSNGERAAPIPDIVSRRMKMMVAREGAQMVTDEDGRVIRGGWWTRRTKEKHSKDSGENPDVSNDQSFVGTVFFYYSFSLLKGRVMVAAATYGHGM